MSVNQRLRKSSFQAPKEACTIPNLACLAYFAVEDNHDIGLSAFMKNMLTVKGTEYILGGWKYFFSRRFVFAAMEEVRFGQL
jgi:hypothetical protein